MRYLVETNIISEAIKPFPNEKVIQWLLALPSNSIYISVLSLGEIRRGIEKLETSKQNNHLVAWLEIELPKWFGENILPIDIEEAERWGYILAQSSHPVPAIDALIAATALAPNVKVVTRNSVDFNISGLEVINPFEF